LGRKLKGPESGRLRQPAFVERIEVLVRKAAEYYVKVYERTVFTSPLKTAPIYSPSPGDNYTSPANVRDDQHRFLSVLRQLPARLTSEQVAWVLNCQPHDVPVLVMGRLLKPLANPSATWTHREIRSLAASFVFNGVAAGEAIPTPGFQDLITDLLLF
jgi:hypothetical protein